MSAEKINRALETKIKHVFKTALRCVEIKFGDQFEGYDMLRSEILRTGNNAIRELKELVNSELGETGEEEPTKVKVSHRRGSNV